MRKQDIGPMISLVIAIVLLLGMLVYVWLPDEITDPVDMWIDNHL